MRTVLRAGALILLLGVGGVAYFLLSATDRAIAQLDHPGPNFRVGRLGLPWLKARSDDPKVVEAFARWVVRHADDPSRDSTIMGAAAESFKKRKPEQTDSFIRAAAILFPSRYQKEVSGWVANWEHPSVTAVLEEQLTRFDERKDRLSPHQTLRLIEELERRKVPHSPAYLDTLLRVYAKSPEEQFLPFFRSESAEALSAMLTRASASPKEELRRGAVLLSFELGHGKPEDLATVLASFDACAQEMEARYGLFTPIPGFYLRGQDLLEGKKSPKEIWDKISEPSRGCGAQKRALLALGKAAVPSLIPRYESIKLLQWTFAASVLIQSDLAWLAQEVEKSVLLLLAAEAKKAPSQELALRVAKGLVALSSAPASPSVERCYLLAFSTDDWRPHYMALAGLQERLPPEALAAAVLLFISDKSSFHTAEIDGYTEVLVKLGPLASPAVVKSMEDLLAKAQGNPARIRWVQKVIAIQVLKEVGDEGALNILSRYAADTSSFESIVKVQNSRTKEERTNKKLVSFRDACLDAIAAIKKRTKK